MYSVTGPVPNPSLDLGAHHHRTSSDSASGTAAAKGGEEENGYRPNSMWLIGVTGRIPFFLNVAFHIF